MEYQRLPCPYFYQAELMISASPVREWLDNEFDVFAMLADTKSMNRLWLHELDPRQVPRQRLRGAVEFPQSSAN